MGNAIHSSVTSGRVHSLLARPLQAKRMHVGFAAGPIVWLGCLGMSST